MFVRLQPYFQPILTACLLFPFAAGVFTLPFTIVNYRKFGGIAIMRVFIVYSFILYSMCAFLLTVLPLPSREAVAAMPVHSIGWVPFRDLAEGLEKSGVLASPFSGAAWLSFLRSPQFFQALANIIMQIPLGIYLRYYFRCNWKKTLLIGFCVSLFYELTQLSGLFFIYPKAYRYTEMDDLIFNTLGAMIGFFITPLLCRFLPTRDEIDSISYRKGERLTLIRRFIAAMLDAFICVLILPPLLYLLSAVLSGFGLFSVTLCFLFVYFTLLPWLCRGSTLGQLLLRLRIVPLNTMMPARFRQLFIRNLFLYFIEPLILLADVFSVSIIVLSLAGSADDPLSLLFFILFPALIILLSLVFFLGAYLRHNTFPHGQLSRTRIVIIPRSVRS